MRSSLLTKLWYTSGARRALLRLNARIPKNEKDRVGRWGERAALRHIERHRLTTVRHNWHAGAIEADIIAFDRRTLVVLEVKTRRESHKHEYPALSAVGPDKRLRLHRLARSFLRNYGPLCRRHTIRGYRVDAIEIYYRKNALGLRVVTELRWHKGINERPVSER